jgi:hypothetical protein
MIKKYQIPREFNVELKTTYKGNRIAEDFFVKNPEIAVLYPNQYSVLEVYKELKIKTSNNMQSILEVTENGIIEHIDIVSF